MPVSPWLPPHWHSPLHSGSRDRPKVGRATTTPSKVEAARARRFAGRSNNGRRLQRPPGHRLGRRDRQLLPQLRPRRLPRPHLRRRRPVQRHRTEQLTLRSHGRRAPHAPEPTPGAAVHLTANVSPGADQRGRRDAPPHAGQPRPRRTTSHPDRSMIRKVRSVTL